MSRPRKTRTYRTGSVRKSTDGKRWEGWYSHGTGKDRVRIKVTAPSQAEAREKLNAVAERARTTDVTTAPKTVGELAERWSTHFPQRAVATHDRINLHIVGDPIIARVKLHELTIDHVEDWLVKKNGSREGGYSHRYLTLMRDDLGTMSRWAMTRRWMPHDPTRGAAIPAVESSNPKRSLTPDEANTFVETCQASTRANARFLLVMVLTGCRPGEVAAIRDGKPPADNVDYDNGILHIRQALRRGSGGRPAGLGDVKGQGFRSIEVDPRVIEAIRKEKVHQARMRLAAGPRWSADWRDFVFLTANGTPPWASNLRKSLALLIEDSGIASHWTPYELRHTFGTLLCEDGAPVGEVADLMGHSDERMMWRNYRHRTDPVVRQRARIARVFQAN